MGLFQRSKHRHVKSRSAALRRRRLIQLEGLEDRRLLANLNLLTTNGNLIFGGQGAEVNDLEISFAGGEYTFADNNGNPINAIGGLNGLDLDPSPSVVRFDAAAADAAVTGGIGAIAQIILNGNAGDDTYTINSLRGGANEGLDIRDDPGEGNDTVIIAGSLGSPGAELGNQVLLRGESILIGGDVFTANQALTAFSDVDLTAALTIDTGAGTTTFNGAIDGGFALNVEAGLADFGDAVGGVTPVAELTASAADIQVDSVDSVGAVSLTATSQITASAGIDSGGDLSLIAPDINLNTAGALTYSSGGGAGDTLLFDGIVTSAAGPDLSLVGGGGDVSVTGDIGGIASLDASGENLAFGGAIGAINDIALAGASGVVSRSLTSTAGSVSVSGPLALGGATSTLVSAATSITMTDTLVGNGAGVTVRDAATADFQGDLSGVGLLDIQLPGGGQTNLSSVAADAVLVRSDAIELAGDVLAADAGVELEGAVEVVADVVISSGGDASDDVILRDTLDGAFNVELRAGLGTVQNAGGAAPEIGGTTPLTSLLASGGTVVNLQAVTVDGGDAILEGGRITLNGPVTGDNVVSEIVFRTQLPGGTLEVYNRPTAPSSPNMTVAGNSFANISDFVAQRFGGPATGTVAIIGDNANPPITSQLVLNLPTEFIGDTVTNVEIIDQGAFPDSVLFRANNLLLDGQFSNSGDVILEKLTPGGTLSIDGNIGSLPQAAPAGFGQHALIVSAPGSTVDLLGEVGGTLTMLEVNADAVDLSNPTAVNFGGDVVLNADVTLAGGIFTQTGSIELNGATTLSSNVLFRVAPGSDLTTGPIDAAGFDVTVRGNGGALGTASIGSLTNGGDFAIDSSGGQTAADVALGEITAEGIFVRADAIATDGTLTATAGNLHLLGPVTLAGNTALNNTSGLSTRFVRIDGAVTGGGNDLSVNAGPSSFVITGAGVTGVNDLTIQSGGKNYLTVAITVAGNFSWTVGTPGNGLNDRIIIAGAGIVTAGGSIDLEADVLQGENAGVNLVAGTINLIERGAGD